MQQRDKHLEFTVPEEAMGERLDRFLPGAMEREGRILSRSVLQTWIRDGGVTVNGIRVKPRSILDPGDRILVEVPEEVAEELRAEAMDLSVLHEDGDIIVIDKPVGLVVHPGAGNARGTLVNGLLHHCGGELCSLAGADRPGIVHRLDKDTSGCLVATKSERAYRSLVAQFSGRETGKEYLAVTNGIPAEREGTLRNRIGRHPVSRQRMAVVDAPAGKEAATDFRVVRDNERENWATLICVIHTGRTHQIRVHLKECLRCPILGDVVYGQPSRQKIRTERLMLHARILSFLHPSTGERMRFEARVPTAFERFL